MKSSVEGLTQSPGSRSAAVFLLVLFQRGAGGIQGTSGFIATGAHPIVVRRATGED